MEAPEDEMILAELIAVASAHRLRSCRGSLFQDKDGFKLEGYGKGTRTPGVHARLPKGAVACCATGASLLLPQSKITDMVFAPDGNDALENDIVPESLSVDDLRSWNIGAAFEIALRGSDE